MALEPAAAETITAGTPLPQCAAERARVEAEYRRRAREIDPNLYAPWQPAHILLRTESRRRAAILLRRAGVFPRPGDQCLEIGFGRLGWLGDLIVWGVRETDLHGIDLDADRVRRATEILPAADLRVGDASHLPWPASTFRLVVASTVFTSILDGSVRRVVASEATRVLTSGGALLWYDFAVNNPRNAHARGVRRRELRELFPTLRGRIETVTLAPPLARFVARRSWTLAAVLEAIPLLRTHLVAVLAK